MKKTLHACTFVVILSMVPLGVTFGQSVLFNFGTEDFTEINFTTNDFSITQTATDVSISGNAGSSLAGTLSSAISIEGISTITISGNSFVGVGDFDGNFFDANNNAATFSNGSFDDLATSGISSLIFSSADTGFNPQNVTGFQLAGGGSPGSTVSGTLTTTAAIPEPSAYATILGLLGLGYAVFCRRRRSSSTD